MGIAVALICVICLCCVSRGLWVNLNMFARIWEMEIKEECMHDLQKIVNPVKNDDVIGVGRKMKSLILFL